MDLIYKNIPNVCELSEIKRDDLMDIASNDEKIKDILNVYAARIWELMEEYNFKNKTYECVDCNIKFIKFEKYKSHVCKTFICPRCNTTYTNINSYNYHTAKQVCEKMPVIKEYGNDKTGRYFIAQKTINKNTVKITASFTNDTKEEVYNKFKAKVDLYNWRPKN